MSRLYFSDRSLCERWHGLGWGCPMWLWRISPVLLKRLLTWFMWKSQDCPECRKSP